MNALVHSVGVSFAEMERLAESVARSRLFGIQTPDQALALMAISQAEGRHPALAARDYDIIQGRPTKKAEAMQRDFLAAGGKIEWEALDDTRACATFSHPQGGSIRIDWDMARATKAGLAGKDLWKKYPRNMLRARVVSEGVRTAFPAATSGMYVPEEVHDIPREMVDVTPQKRTPPHDPVTGEIHEEQFTPGPTIADLEARFVNYAAEGMARLEAEWKALATDQRVALGAGRGTSGPKMAYWKTIATSADANKQAPADEPPESPQADSLGLRPVGEAQTDDEASANIIAQAQACETLDAVQQVKDHWRWRMSEGRMSQPAWDKTMAAIGARETELWRASR